MYVYKIAIYYNKNDENGIFTMMIKDMNTKINLLK